MRGQPLDAREQDNLAADLSAYLDGELEPQRAAEVKHTLDASPEARRLRESAPATRGLYDRLREFDDRRRP